MAELFPDNGRLPDPTITATYDYVDEDGTLLFEVVRSFPKAFRQRRPDGHGGWVWNLNGTRRVLYRLPQVMKAARESRRVFVVEGERDVHAIERAGEVATTNPAGSGKWRDEFSRFLVGADVVIVADDDDAGRRHAEQVRVSLYRAGVRAPVLLPKAGKDAADHLAAGFRLEEFRPAAEPAPSSETRQSIRAADVHPEAVDWLWRDRIPLGMVTVVGGFPGVGKSTILYDVAARVSCEGRAVLVATAEDHLAAVVRPRLEAAGADLELVHLMLAPLTLSQDAPRLAGLVRELDAALLILDPLVAFIGDDVNTHRDHHVRRVLAPLASLAESTRAAVLVVIHTNKGLSTEPLMRISGSIGFTGAARAVLLAAEDPQDETRRILAVVKSNLAEHPPPLAYRLVGVDLDGGIATSRVEWLGEAPEVDVRELLAGRDPEERTDREEAMEFLREAGVLTTARLARDLEEEAKSLAIHGKTLQRARRALGVPAWKHEFQGPTLWGPRPGSKLDTQSGHPHPVQTVQIGPDLRKRGLGTPNLDKGAGAGDGPLSEPEVLALIASELDGEVGQFEPYGEAP